ncbi:MAG: hypothetical protein M5U19_13675 [Microthrixaceae bacterium]|nr:hypothetical protein [Microthrixaceae bacterium]
MSTPTATRAHPYLERLAEKVIVFDGATGTWLQEHDLTADDFGGAELEGCNEILVETRPELIVQMHREVPRSRCRRGGDQQLRVLRRALG